LRDRYGAAWKSDYVMNALIVSLNFNPGHFSHLVANYRLFEELGYEPYLYINSSFNRMDDANEFRKINTSDQHRELGPVSIAVFWFPSVRNIGEIVRLRLSSPARIVYVFHEPFDSIKAYRDSGFGWLKIARIVMINLVNIPVLFLSHRIILPSLAAYSLYEKKYTALNGNYCRIPLPFDDEAVSGRVEFGEKEFFSYIGTIAADHAFDRFVDFVDIAVSNGWLTKQKFLVATRSTIPARERQILHRLLQSGRVVIREGAPLTTQEMNHHYQRSLVVWNAYNRSMQSGVLPKAYMFGAAVITLRRNANEFVDDRETCILIDDNTDKEEIRKAVEEIERRSSEFAQRCRERFLKTFYYKGMVASFRRLVESQ